MKNLPRTIINKLALVPGVICYAGYWLCINIGLALLKAGNWLGEVNQRLMP